MNNEHHKIEALKAKGLPEYIWKHGLDIWIKRWNNFVDEIELGYSGEVDEYVNDLETREVIDLIGYSDLSAVKEIDKRYKSLLQDTDKRVWKSDNDSINDWWNFGVPRNINEDFKKKLIL